MKELEMVLSAISQLGAAGKEAFIWWLVFDKLIVGVLYLVGIFGFWLCLKLFLSRLGGGERVRDAMQVGTPGPLTEREVDEMIEWIKKHQQQ